MEQVLIKFDEFYSKLTEDEKIKLLEHIEHNTRLMEGYFAGPAVQSKSYKCPVCGAILRK